MYCEGVSSELVRQNFTSNSLYSSWTHAPTQLIFLKIGNFKTKKLHNNGEPPRAFHNQQDSIFSLFFSISVYLFKLYDVFIAIHISALRLSIHDDIKYEREKQQTDGWVKQFCWTHQKHKGAHCKYGHYITLVQVSLADFSDVYCEECLMKTV